MTKRPNYEFDRLLSDIRLANERFRVTILSGVEAKILPDGTLDCPEEIKKKVGVDIGSGYPADPITKAFISENYNKYPDIFRKTWQTYKKLVASKQQKGLGDF